MASEETDLPHVFLVSFPGQGHINPMLRLGKKLAAVGLLVTFSTTAYLRQDMINAGSISSDHRRPTSIGRGFLRFEFFDDGRSQSKSFSFTFKQYLPQLQRLGAASLKKILKDQTNQNLPPVSCLIGNPFVPWVCDVATDLGISSAVFWVQSAAVFSIYYHHFIGAVPFPSETQPKTEVQLPFLPLLKHDEIPSFLLPGDEDNFGAIGKAILEQFRNLSEVPSCVLIDTFDELEAEIVNDMSRIFPIRTVGPLFMKWGHDDQIINETKVSGDCVKFDECMEWLDLKAAGSVVYVSFGSVVHLKQQEVDEIAFGLKNSGFPFLWVLKPPSPIFGVTGCVIPKQVLEAVGERGKVVQWSPQERVLSHPSVGCFVTHCGWNSSVEAISSAVPVVAFPQWGDQVTNAKFLVDVFGVGLRLSRGAGEDRVVSRDEIQNCLTEAMESPTAAELRLNASKWKKAAEKAVAHGGSSERNFRHFTDHIRNRSDGFCGEPSQSQVSPTSS